MIRRHKQTKINHAIVECNGVLYFGGVVADDLTQDMKGQTTQICNKIDGLLSEVGSSKSELLTATVYISDFSQKAGMNEAWLGWLSPDQLPTRATIGVADLGDRVLIEVVLSAARSQ